MDKIRKDWILIKTKGKLEIGKIVGKKGRKTYIVEHWTLTDDQVSNNIKLNKCRGCKQNGKKNENLES